jgi:hypothetical protein
LGAGVKTIFLEISIKKLKFSNILKIFYIPNSHSLSLIHRKDFGLERFVPASLIDGMKRKELRRLVGHFLKLNSQMTGSSKMLTQLQVLKHYLFIKRFHRYRRQHHHHISPNS